MLKLIISVLLGLIIFFLGAKVFAIVFWGTGLNMIDDLISVDKIEIKENDDAERSTQ